MIRHYLPNNNENATVFILPKKKIELNWALVRRRPHAVKACSDSDKVARLRALGLGHALWMISRAGTLC
jgi:hypothetical protein